MWFSAPLHLWASEANRQWCTVQRATSDRISRQRIGKSEFQIPADYCYLFGSYAKNKATPSSDVDLLISVKLDGLQYFELIETLREKLKKRVDLLSVSQLKDNLQLLNEILKDVIKIYG